MNGKIYIIVEGEYSDWKIQGYHKNMEEALLICKKHNDSLVGAFAHQHEWYITEASDIKAPAEERNKCDFVYSFAFFLDDSAASHFEDVPQCIPKGTKESGFCVETLPYSHRKLISGEIVLNHIDYPKAQKIMYDMVAQAKAKIDGII